jgi:hypothetical protein
MSVISFKSIAWQKQRPKQKQQPPKSRQLNRQLFAFRFLIVDTDKDIYA